MATGSGKTTVMAMLIAWQTVNAVRRASKLFSRAFLIVAPGITIKDRLRDQSLPSIRQPARFRFFDSRRRQNCGPHRYIMSRSTLLALPPEIVWSEVQKASLLMHIAWPLVRFVPAENQPIRTFKPGGRYLVKLRLFGILPFGAQWIETSVRTRFRGVAQTTP